jgi:hypothetical protein
MGVRLKVAQNRCTAPIMTDIGIPEGSLLSPAKVFFQIVDVAAGLRSSSAGVAFMGQRALHSHG